MLSRSRVLYHSFNYNVDQFVSVNILVHSQYYHLLSYGSSFNFPSQFLVLLSIALMTSGAEVLVPSNQV